MIDGHKTTDARCEAYQTALTKIATIALRRTGHEWDLILAYIGQAQLGDHPTSDRARALKALTGCAWWWAYQQVTAHPLDTPEELARTYKTE